MGVVLILTLIIWLLLRQLMAMQLQISRELFYRPISRKQKTLEHLFYMTFLALGFFLTVVKIKTIPFHYILLLPGGLYTSRACYEFLYKRKAKRYLLYALDAVLVWGIFAAMVIYTSPSLISHAYDVLLYDGTHEIVEVTLKANHQRQAFYGPSLEGTLSIGTDQFHLVASGEKRGNRYVLLDPLAQNEGIIDFSSDFMQLEGEVFLGGIRKSIKGPLDAYEKTPFAQIHRHYMLDYQSEFFIKTLKEHLYLIAYKSLADDSSGLRYSIYNLENQTAIEIPEMHEAVEEIFVDNDTLVFVSKHGDETFDFPVQRVYNLATHVLEREPYFQSLETSNHFFALGTKEIMRSVESLYVEEDVIHFDFFKSDDHGLPLIIIGAVSENTLLLNLGGIKFRREQLVDLKEAVWIEHVEMVDASTLLLTLKGVSAYNCYYENQANGGMDLRIRFR